MKNYGWLLMVSALVASFSFADDKPATEAPKPDASLEERNPAAPNAQKFSGEQLAIKKYMEDLFEESKHVNAGGDSQKKSRSYIENAMDWDKVAEGCLGKNNAKKASGNQLQEFRNLLRQVIVKTAYSRLDKFWNNTTYTFDAIEVKGGMARVAANFIVNDEPFLLEYFLDKKDGKWRVYDISYENQRYSTNINEQLEAFLKENNSKFSTLLDKLKKRNQELDTPKTTRKASSLPVQRRG